MDVGPLLLDCVADLAALAAAKQIELEVDVRGKALCRGAPEEVRVLFSNLIHNAVRYTPTGGRNRCVNAGKRRPHRRRGLQFWSATAQGRGSDAGSHLFFCAAPQEIEGSGLGLRDRPARRGAARFRPDRREPRWRRDRRSGPSFRCPLQLRQLILS